MLAKALVAAILGLGLQLTVSLLLQFGPVLAGIRHARFDLLSLLYALAVSLIPTGTLILFLVTYLREVSTRGGARARQLAAALGAFGQAVQLWHLMSYARRFVPYHPARYWPVFVVSLVLPALLWLMLLLVYWNATAPADRRLTGRVAAVLCVLTLAAGIHGIYMMAEGRIGVTATGWDLWRMIALRAANLAGWVSLAVLLFAFYRSCGRRAQPL